MELRTLVFRTRRELENCKAEWLDLLEHAVTGTIFQSPDWALGWWAMVQPGSQLFCVALYEGDTLVGLAPLCIVKQWGIRAIQFMGGAANDSNQFVVRAGYENALGTRFRLVLAEMQSQWDVIQFTPTSVNDPVMTMLREPLARKYSLISLRPTALPYFSVPPTWEQYWSSITHKHRRQWSYSRRRLGRKGDISFRVVMDKQGVAEGIEHMAALHKRNWQRRRQHKKLAPLNRKPEFLDTLSSVSVSLAERGQVWLGQLCFNNQPISWLLSLRQNDTLYDYMTAYDLDYALYSPGVWVSLEMTREAIRQRILYYRVGRGEQTYKFWMGAKAAYAEGLHVAQKSSRGILFSMVHTSQDYAARVYYGLCK